MKKLTKIICAAMALLMLAACGAKSDNKITAPISDVVNAVKTAADFSDAYFVSKDDEYSDDVLNYQYGVTDEAVIAKITDFILTEPDSLSAKTFAMILFTDDVTKEELDATAEAIKENYVKNRMSALKMYDPDQYAIAEATSIAVYDNAVVVVSFDLSGNTAILEAVAEAGK